jgi:hypothetical protein
MRRLKPDWVMLRAWAALEKLWLSAKAMKSLQPLHFHRRIILQQAPFALGPVQRLADHLLVIETNSCIKRSRSGFLG